MSVRPNSAPSRHCKINILCRSAKIIIKPRLSIKENGQFSSYYYVQKVKETKPKKPFNTELNNILTNQEMSPQ